MGRADSPPDSPLSSMGSMDPYDDLGTDAEDGPPAKRPKLGSASVAASPAVASTAADGAASFLDDDQSDATGVDNADPEISSDSEGEIPTTPLHSVRPDEDAGDFHEQVTVCAWEDCDGGDQGNMDLLVQHIHAEHIESRQKQYTCEWQGCPRKSMPHASGYALKAHMRSHTREKPFYCYLPGEFLQRCPSSSCWMAGCLLSLILACQ